MGCVIRTNMSVMLGPGTAMQTNAVSTAAGTIMSFSLAEVTLYSTRHSSTGSNRCQVS